jgi:hypothetical protein
MKLLYFLGAIALLSFQNISCVIGWGHEGHELIGRVAMTLLSPKTKDAIAKIIPRVNGDISKISSWADQIKRNSRYFLFQ